MFDIMNLVWTLVIVGSIATIGIRLRYELKNSV